VSPTLRIGRENVEPAVTEEEIKEWIDVGKEEGTIEQGEQDMLYSVLEFGDTPAREIMTPRVDVVLVEDTSSIDDAIRIFNETGFSRIPVYQGDITNVTGIIVAKDLLAAPAWRIRKIPRVNESDRAMEVLRLMQRRGEHLAVVEDSNHQVIGIVSLEDLLEELVGEIRSED